MKKILLINNKLIVVHGFSDGDCTECSFWKINTCTLDGEYCISEYLPKKYEYSVSKSHNSCRISLFTIMYLIINKKILCYIQNTY